jgi:hypothetical protein
MKNPCRLVVAAAASSFLAASAHAAFVLIDDFESYTPDTSVIGQNGWVGESDVVGDAIIDPDDVTNQALRHSDPGGGADSLYNASSAINIADGTTGTLFLRAQFVNTPPNTIFGLSDDSTPTGGFGDFESAARFGDGSDDFDVRDGGAYDDAASIDQGTWYNIWFVIDNDTDTTEFYLQSDADSNFATQTLVSSTTDPVDFRNGTNDALTSFLIIADGSTDVALFDDIYIDTTGENLVNPIPEPATAGVVAAGLLGLLTRRRR